MPMAVSSWTGFGCSGGEVTTGDGKGGQFSACLRKNAFFGPDFIVRHEHAVFNRVHALHGENAHEGCESRGKTRGKFVGLENHRCIFQSKNCALHSKDAYKPKKSECFCKVFDNVELNI